MAIAQEYERGPEFDLEGTSKRAAAPISNLDMAHIRMRRESGCQQWLGRVTVPTPGAAEFEQCGPDELIDLGAFGFVSCIFFVDRHV